MQLIPQEYMNIVMIVFLVGLILPAIITELYGDTHIVVQTLVVSIFVFLPILLLVYNLVASIVAAIL